jgi:hypothetical protein
MFEVCNVDGVLYSTKPIGEFPLLGMIVIARQTLFVPRGRCVKRPSNESEPMEPVCNLQLLLLGSWKCRLAVAINPS